MTLKITAALIAIVGIPVLAIPAEAFATRPLPYETELNSCIAAIHRHIDLDGANRVRYIVRDTDRSQRGYELKIDTIVFGSGPSREYQAVCLTRGSLEPMKLEIDGKRV